MSIYGLLSFALIYFIFVVTPGPGVAATVARGLGIGLHHAAPFTAGFVLGDIVWFTIAATGLSALANNFATAFYILKLLGCAYLFYLAWKMWWTPIITTSVEASVETTTASGSFTGTLLLTLGNPKVVVFFVSLMPVAVDVQHMTFASYVTLATTMAIVCASSLIGCLFLATRARLVFSSAKALQRINRGAAAMMAGAAGLIAARA
jgi:threonine/homoserine/homoserine lactone efflux protein